MTGVFLETVGLLGLWDEDDQWHPQALAVYGEISRRRDRLYTTTYIIGECANASARWIDRQKIAILVRSLEATGGFVFPADADWREAWDRYLARQPGAPGLVDELSFAVMRRLGLRRAFTNDRHFSDAGFEPLF